MKPLFSILSVICYIFAVADVVLYYIFGVDLTGVSWSPIIAGGLGWLFATIAGSEDK